MAYRYYVKTVEIPRGHHLARRMQHKISRLLEYRYISATDMFLCTVMIEEEVPDDEPVTEPEEMPMHPQATKASAGS